LTDREIDDLRRRLVLAADDDRRRIERDLHDGPQQHLVALAANLQVARRLVDSDPEAAKALVDEMGRDVHQALDETRALAHRIYPPLLDAGGLGPALRATAAGLGVSARVELDVEATYPREAVAAVYFCCAEALELLALGVDSAAVNVRDDDDALVFEIVAEGSANPDLGRVRDRVQGLGGQVTVASEPGPRIRVSGVLPGS
jgi:signal transduction histidine kinase